MWFFLITQREPLIWSNSLPKPLSLRKLFRYSIQNKSHWAWLAKDSSLHGQSTRPSLSYLLKREVDTHIYPPLVDSPHTYWARRLAASNGLNRNYYLNEHPDSGQEVGYDIRCGTARMICELEVATNTPIPYSPPRILLLLKTRNASSLYILLSKGFAPRMMVSIRYDSIQIGWIRPTEQWALKTLI